MVLNLAIVGAGPAGLTLARLLQVNDLDIHITIFEHDASSTSRFYQGGTLDLHTDTGLAALKKARLWDEALKHLRFDGEELSIADKNGTVLLYKDETPKPKTVEEELDYSRPEIDREVLKEMLLQSVKADQVKWGKTLQSIEPTTGILTFRDGTAAGPFDLVVGADGAWSKVRHVLTDVRPRYAGVCSFESRIANPDREQPSLAKLVGRGSYFCFSDSKMLTGQRLGDESIRVGMSIKSDQASYGADLVAAAGGDEEKLRLKLLEHFADWDPSLQQFIRAGTKFRPWPLYEMPVGETWQHRRGYTMIGDAASLMTPFAGEGVNKAMKDALELAEAVENALRTDTDLDDAVRRYEEVMFPRAKKYQTVTMRNKQAIFSGGGPVEFMVAMVDGVAAEMNWDLHKGWISWIPLKTIVFCLFSALYLVQDWRRRFRVRFSRG